MIASSLRWCLLAFALSVAAPAVSLAQPDPADQRATEFRAVSGPQAESVPGGVLLVSAYAAAWLFLMLYVLRLGRLSARARADVARLEKSLGASGGRTEGEPERGA